MPSDPTNRALRDILHHIDLAKKMADAGNVYRHDYEDVAAQFVIEAEIRRSGA